MDKKAIVAIALSIAVMIGWQYFYSGKSQPGPAAAPVQAEAQPGAAPLSPAPAPTQPAPAVAAPVPAPAPVISAPAETRTISSGKADYLLSTAGGGIESVVLKDHLSEHGENLRLNAVGDAPIGALSPVPGQWPLTDYRFASKTSGDSVTLQGALDGGIEVAKTVTLADPTDPGQEYVVNLDLVFSNPGTVASSTGPLWINLGSAYAVHSRDLPTYTAFDWYGDGSLHDTGVNWFEAGHVPLVGIQTSAARSEYRENVPAVTWAAVKNQYFATLATVREGTAKEVWATRMPLPNPPGGSTAEHYAIAGALGFGSLDLAPGETKTISLQLYTGPKQYSRLKALGPEQAEVMQLGFFKIVSIFLLKMMNWLEHLLGNYAAAIVVMTLLIKSALWPLQNISTRSMRKMQALQPKMTELREKFKDDPTKMNTELMKLYKDYGVNPFSGCLPMLVQIPIFFGFYRMLGVAPELRNSPFLWIHDLSQPDTVAHIAGFPVNVLPLVMAVTMLWQMRLTPKSGDAVQQRVFMFVPLIFVVFCYNYAAALALYWTVQNLFSVVQLYLTRNQQIPALTRVGGADTPKKKRR